MDVTFPCPNPACQQPLKATAALAGQYVRCPACGRVLQLPPSRPAAESPAPGPAPEPAIVSSPAAIRLCPACHAELADGAAPCASCGRTAESRPAPAPVRTWEEQPHAEAHEAEPYRLRDERDDTPRRSRRRRPGHGAAGRAGVRGRQVERQDQFNLLYLGLRLHYGKVVGSLLSIGLLVLAFQLAFVNGQKDRPAGAFVFLGLEPVVGLAVALLGTTAWALCYRAPPRRGLRPLILAALALDGVLIGVRLLGAVLGALAVSPAGGTGPALAAAPFGALGALGTLAGVVLFLFFLRRLAASLGRSDLGDEAMSILRALAAVVGAAFFCALLLGGLTVSLPKVGLSLGGLAVVFLTVVLGKVGLRLRQLLSRLQGIVERGTSEDGGGLLTSLPVWAWVALPAALVFLVGWVALMTLPGSGGVPGAAAATQPGPQKSAPLPPPNVPPPATDFPGLLGYWAFDEGEGTWAADSSGHGYRAALVNAGWADGVRGKALRLSGKGSYLDYSEPPAFSFGAAAPFTLALWARTTERGGTLLSQRKHGDGTPLLDLDFGSGFGDGRLQFHARQDGHGFIYGNVKGGAIDDGRWHHVAATRSGADLELFLDGISQGRATDRTSAGPITTDWRALGSERHNIATGFPAANPHFTGCLDEFCIFGRVLRPEEIAKLAGR